MDTRFLAYRKLHLLTKICFVDIIYSVRNIEDNFIQGGKMMKKRLFIISIMLCMILSACGENKNATQIGGADGPTSINVTENGERIMYEQITAKEAKKIMDSGEEHIILDVREQDEYDSGHIPGAILIPYTEIENRAEEILPDKEALILVYCRSGRRSKIAAESLVGLGYTNIKEFGGIIDWTWELEN